MTTHTHFVQLTGSAKPGLVDRVAAAFGAFVAPERLRPASNDNLAAQVQENAISLADPLALPPEWHTAGDLLSLSFLPFDR